MICCFQTNGIRCYGCRIVTAASGLHYNHLLDVEIRTGDRIMSDVRKYNLCAKLTARFGIFASQLFEGTFVCVPLGGTLTLDIKVEVSVSN